MHPLIPPKLQPNSTIGIVSPSGSFSPERLQPALTYLASKGYQTQLGNAVYAQNRYLAGSDEDRANDLNAMFANPDIHAIFASRGGYGSTRILDLLNWDLIAQNPKPLIGLSDTTALQLGLWTQVHLISYTGLVLCSDITTEGFDTTTEKSVWNAVCHHAFDPISDLTPLRDGNISGTLLGGCLSLVTSLVGTSYLPNFEQAIIFLEDINEPPYRIDRMLNQLLMAGVFKHASGVVFGQFIGPQPDTSAEGTIQDVLNDFAQRITCPVYTNLPYGHAKTRCVMPIGWAGQIENNQLCITNFPSA